MYNIVCLGNQLIQQIWWFWEPQFIRKLRKLYFENTPENNPIDHSLWQTPLQAYELLGYEQNAASWKLTLGAPNRYIYHVAIMSNTKLYTVYENSNPKWQSTNPFHAAIDGHLNLQQEETELENTKKVTLNGIQWTTKEH